MKPTVRLTGKVVEGEISGVADFPQRGDGFYFDAKNGRCWFELRTNGGWSWKCWMLEAI